MCFSEAFCWARTAERQASRIRRKYLMAVLRQEVAFFDTAGVDTAEVVNSISNDTLIIQDVLSEKVPIFIMNLTTFLSCYGAAFYLQWKLALVTLPFITLMIIPGVLYGRKLMAIGGKMLAEHNKASSIADQALSAVRTVYSFVAEEKVMAKFSSALEGTVKLGIKQGLAKGLTMGAIGVNFAIWGFITWYGSTLVLHHGVSPGKILGTGYALILGALALGTALPNIKYFSEASTAAFQIFEMIHRVPEINWEDTNGKVLEKVSGEIELRGVEFIYPSRPDTVILSNFNLIIPAGKTVALVGGSGSGKSTVISLIERFYDPLKGEILLDGENIQNLQLKWLRTQIGLVSQEPALFATSIYENLLFGKEDATMDDVVNAAKDSNAHDFISQLPDGYHTQVGERGVQMSGGQKQRIAIARAILKRPQILLLDEATSALDTESEKIVQEALDKASMDRTTVVVAHRLSTIRNADKIAVVQNGAVIEAGKHEELIHKPNGAYAALVQLQQVNPNHGQMQRSDSVSISAASILLSSRSRQSSWKGSYRSRSRRTVPEQENKDEEENNQMKNEEMKAPPPSFRRLLALNAPEWKQALMGCAGAIGNGALQPAYAFTLGSIISVLFLKDEDEMKRKVKIYCAIFVCLSLWSCVVSFLQHYNFAAMGELLTRRIRLMMLGKLLTFEIGWFDLDENSSGALCSMLGKEANVVRSLVADRVSLLTEALSGVGVACILGLVIAWRLAIVIIALQPLIITCYYTRKVLLRNIAKKSVEYQEEGCLVAAESVVNHRTITALCSQDRILRLFDSKQEVPHREISKDSWYAGLGLAASQALTILNWAMDLWYGGKLVSQGIITKVDLFRTILILIRAGRIIADAGSMTSDLARGADTVESLFEILDKNTLICPDDPEGIKTQKLEGNVDLENVDFAYPARPNIIIFQNFFLNIKAGSSMALVGQSGCGKSTIIGLIERFYDPLKGRVKLDGKDIRSYNLRSLRQHIALVGQEPTLFAGSIRENIAYGKDDATEAEVIEAAKAANAHEFISCLQDGYDTNTGERGVQLSGGQKQRIAIARAIIKNPSILLLDEATSALDAQSEKVVQEALDGVMVGRTSVIVAHRLTTIQNSDCIAVIEKGRIVEQGSHSRLLSKGEGGAYFSLVKIQQQNHSPLL
ncbi:putative multidrug resistance protein [Cryptomeria japonica]|uniref:putative multidrug resistance protein n=1 Tax=Cryptomeria japonica TaxID=3369 RepID=UPI0027D9F944|nr:putative multidrug resistance protein [Cryptomeria japonica]